MDETEDEPVVVPEEGAQDEQSWGDKMLVSGRELSPRHRKLCELAAQGIPQHKIAEQLEYTPSRVSILLSNTKIKEEVARIRERIYEDTIGKRLKSFADPAMNEIERCLTDRTNRYKEQLKVETAKWVVEKLDGKAVQKYDIGENTLGVMMDRLDAMKNAGRSLDQMIDVTPLVALDSPEKPASEAPKETTPEQDELTQWVNDFTTASQR